MSDVDDKTAPLGSLAAYGSGEVIASADDGSTLASDDEAPRALEASEIRARRRPRALLLVWGWELACAMFIAIPVHTWARKVWGAHPDGDTVLFRPGGHALVSWLGDDGPALSIVLRTSFAAFLLFGIVGQLVTGMLIASLATGRGNLGLATKTSYVLRGGASAFFPLVGIGVVALAIQGFLIGVGFLVSSSVDHALIYAIGDARSFTVRLVVFSLFAIVAAVVGVSADLVRVSVARASALGASLDTRENVDVRSAIRSALRATRSSLGRATLAWGWRAAIGAALIWVGASAGDLVSGRGGAVLWLLFGFHQLLLFARTALRASWLANALRLVLGSTPQPRSSATTT